MGMHMYINREYMEFMLKSTSCMKYDVGAVASDRPFISCFEPSLVPVLGIISLQRYVAFTGTKYKFFGGLTVFHRYMFCVSVHFPMKEDSDHHRNQYSTRVLAKLKLLKE